MEKPKYRRRHGWLNLYQSPSLNSIAQAGGVYRTREEADNVCKRWRMDCVPISWWEPVKRINHITRYKRRFNT